MHDLSSQQLSIEYVGGRFDGEVKVDEQDGAVMHNIHRTDTNEIIAQYVATNDLSKDGHRIFILKELL